MPAARWPLIRLVRTEPAHGRLRFEHGIDLDRRAIRRERTTEVPREGPTPRRRMRGTRTVEGPVSRRPGNGDCRKGTAGADPQWPVHVCRTRLSETVNAGPVDCEGHRRKRRAARQKRRGPITERWSGRSFTCGSTVAVRATGAARHGKRPQTKPTSLTRGVTWSTCPRRRRAAAWKRADTGRYLRENSNDRGALRVRHGRVAVRRAR